MNKVYKLDQQQVQKQLQTFNSSFTIDRILKVSSFLSEYNLLLTEVIGCGAFGVVLKGYDDYNSREVAVKIMINQNSEKKKELEEEIKIIRKIKSEYVIKIYEHFYDEESSCFMIVMEYCKHGDLFSYFNIKKSLEKEEIIQLFTHFLVGLQDIHTKGIIHSDIKPQNILLAENYKLKICDLGLSKILSNNKSFTANKGGTPVYSSLEQMCGKVRLESDYYSAGAVLCFLSGLDIENNLSMAFQLKNGVFPDINNMKQKDLIQIGFQMMQVDPLQRIKPEIACGKLNNLKDNNGGNIIRSQTESQKDKEVKNGVWIYIWNNGNKYEGEWKNDNRNGQGTFYWQSGDKYEGEWKDDQKSGQGSFYWSSGNKYVGKWENGNMSGYGVFQSVNGNRYKGEYKDNKKSGQGSFYWPGGDKYVGKWENDNMNGYGVKYFNDGDRYEGEWKDDVKSGQGTYYYRKSGDKYVGNYEQGNKNGYGIIYFASGNRYEGEWKDDQRSGKGSNYFENGDKYVGKYLNDKRNGEGIFYYDDGRYEKRFYKDGVLQKQ